MLIELFGCEHVLTFKKKEIMTSKAESQTQRQRAERHAQKLGLREPLRAQGIKA